MPAGKGPATVIMNSEDYHRKLSQLLNEENTDRAVPDPTSVIKRKLRELLQTFKKTNKISEKSIFDVL